MGWALGTPPEEPRQLWHSKGAKTPGSSNVVGFANEEADTIIEALQYEYDHEERLKLYHRFHQIIHEEQPYTFLYSPKSILLYREYVQNLFIPAERQDLIPGADIAEPSTSVIWLKPQNSR
jgi:peptide/nickel transport system substrate-binding protein